MGKNSNHIERLLLKERWRRVNIERQLILTQIRSKYPDMIENKDDRKIVKKESENG